MFATIKSLIPEPRQANHPRNYVGRHRRADPMAPALPAAPNPELPALPAPVSPDTALGAQEQAEEAAAV